MHEREILECCVRLENSLRDLLEPLDWYERWQQGSVYVSAILLKGERKLHRTHGQPHADCNAQAMQQFIGRSPGNSCRKEPAYKKSGRELVKSNAQIADDMGFAKKGISLLAMHDSFRYERESGNCQVAVSIHLATDDACQPSNFARHLLESWTKDPDRMRRAGVPKEAHFKTKWHLALDQMDESFRWGISKRVFFSDILYSKINEFRQDFMDRELCYVVEVESRTLVCSESDALKAEKGGAKTMGGSLN